MLPEELTKANLSSAVDGANIVYFDVRLPDTALLVAEEVISSCLIISVHNDENKKEPTLSAIVIAGSILIYDFLSISASFCTGNNTILCLWINPVQASLRKIPIWIDAERKGEGLDELLNFASYVVCSAKLSQVSCLIAEECNVKRITAKSYSRPFYIFCGFFYGMASVNSNGIRKYAGFALL
jgi:hypothetical protein